MQLMQKTDWVATEDTDALVFGARYLLRGITTGQPVLVALAGVLEGLGLSEDKFVDMCLLMGSDFTPKARGFGPVTSFKLVKKEEARVDQLIESGHVAFGKWTQEEKEMFKSAYVLAREKFMAPRHFLVANSQNVGEQTNKGTRGDGGASGDFVDARLFDGGAESAQAGADEGQQLAESGADAGGDGAIAGDASKQERGDPGQADGAE
jgi:hypothetical protein